MIYKLNIKMKAEKLERETLFLSEKSIASSKKSKDNNKKKRNTMKNDFASYLMKEQHTFFKNNKKQFDDLVVNTKSVQDRTIVNSLKNKQVWIKFLTNELNNMK